MTVDKSSQFSLSILCGSSNHSEKCSYIHTNLPSGSLRNTWWGSKREWDLPHSHTLADVLKGLVFRGGDYFAQEFQMASREKEPTVRGGGRWMTHRNYTEKWTLVG